MKTKSMAVFLLIAAALIAPEAPLFAQDSDERGDAAAEIEAIHHELRSLRDSLVRAVNEQDIDGVMRYLHPEVVVTWQNAEVSRGHAGVREYYQRMMEGPARIVKSFEFAVEPEELTILHGDDAGIVFGNSTDKFSLSRGLEFEHRGRWSASLVKENDRWLVANFHASTNLFDNPLLAIARKTTMWAGIGAFAIGLLLGWLVIGRRKRSAG